MEDCSATQYEISHKWSYRDLQTFLLDFGRNLAIPFFHCGSGSMNYSPEWGGKKCTTSALPPPRIYGIRPLLFPSFQFLPLLPPRHACGFTAILCILQSSSGYLGFTSKLRFLLPMFLQVEFRSQIAFHFLYWVFMLWYENKFSFKNMYMCAL